MLIQHKKTIRNEWP